VKLNNLKHKVTNNRMAWYKHILRMNKERIPKKILKKKVKGKCPRGRPRSR
jgi:hypothetical protein